jgi:hypothetical protein
MILVKKISSKEVLEIISEMARESLPENFEGELHLRYDDDDAIEIFAMEKDKNKILN